MKLLRCTTPLGLFALLWAFAAVLHYLEARPLAGLPLYPFVLLLWLGPERLWALASFACAHVTLLVLDLPAAANHSILALLVNAGLLLGCVPALHSATAASRQRRLWESVRGPLQATVIIVYFFAVFHKLNSAFFDPDISCAISQVARLFELHGFPEPPTTVVAFAGTIYLTILIEAAIVVCLLWRRSTHWGMQWWRALGVTQMTLVYERQGAWYVAEDAFADRDIMRPLAFWERWLLAFRAVQDDGAASECRW